jgi:hypothetical protein
MLAALGRDGTDRYVLRQIGPANYSRRIDQELRRTRDIGALRPCATMQEIVTSNHFRFRIGQECVGETQFLALTAIDFRWVDTNRGEMNPARFKFRKPMLKTPQLGVAQRSPETAIEDQQDSF